MTQLFGSFAAGRRMVHGTLLAGAAVLLGSCQPTGAPHGSPARVVGDTTAGPPIPDYLILSSVGLAEAEPDFTKITATIRTRGPSVLAAAAKAARREALLTTALARVQLPTSALWSTTYRTEALPPVPVGTTDSTLGSATTGALFGVQHSVEIAVPDVTRSGIVLDAIQGIPDLYIDGVSTYPRDLSGPTQAATEEALERARQQAHAFGRKVGAGSIKFIRAAAVPLALDSLVAPHGGRHVVRIRLETTWQLGAPAVPITSHSASGTGHGLAPSHPKERPRAQAHSDSAASAALASPGKAQGATGR